MRFQFKYGHTTMDTEIPLENWMGTIQSCQLEGENISEEEVIKNSLRNPVDSKLLKNIVEPGEKICIVISDITRSWQRMNVFLPFIIDELEVAGIKDENITFLCATGSHRKQTMEEHREIIGDALYNRFKVMDHDCHDMDNHVFMGETSYGTPVWLNKIAASSDHIIITGAVVYHDLAGWGGGKKSILPGICGYESIMKNHALSLNPGIGQGINPMVKCGNIMENPLHEDMVEAAQLVNPSYMFNVIMNERGTIAGAVSGHYLKAHELGRDMVEKMDSVGIKEKADMVIVSAGGYPKDIDLYQASKAISNAKEAIKDNGIMILISQCSEGIGSLEMTEMIEAFDDHTEREIFLRNNFSVTRYIGYLMAEVATKFDVILVSDMDAHRLDNINIKIFKTLDEASNYVYSKHSSQLTTYIMPQGANTLPKLV